MTSSTNFLAAETWSDPHPYFDALRQTDPVSWNTWWRGWVITRFDDVDFLLKRSEYMSANTVATARAQASPEQLSRREATFRILGSWLVLNDAPDHTRLRRLTNKAFTPAMVAKLQVGIEARATKLLDAMERKESPDIIADYAHPLTLSVISQMLGIPEGDRDQVAAWGTAITPLVLDGRENKERREVAEATLIKMDEYFAQLLEARRAEPADDLLSQLALAEDQGSLLSENEIIATCILLIFAGQETTTGLIANAVLALGENPSEQAKLVAQPELMRGAVEELLRFCGVAFAISRVATGDFELRGEQIKAGDKLLLTIGAANRDPEQFDEPNRLDITRDTTGHLAFAGGAHYCLGGPLARVEASIAIKLLLDRHPNVQPRPQDIEWRGVIVAREPVALIVDLEPS
jgi:cytochrome P450